MIAAVSYTHLDVYKRQVGKRVRLMYEEHVGIPTSCFGETGYFVHDVQLLDKQ